MKPLLFPFARACTRNARLVGHACLLAIYVLCLTHSRARPRRILDFTEAGLALPNLGVLVLGNRSVAKGGIPFQ